MNEVRIKNLKDLEKFARKFGDELKGGEIIGLIGDLGAGKTTFVQYLAKALGVKTAVKSPTFILMQVFETGVVAKKRGAKHLCHVDAYRLKDTAELKMIGFDDYARNKKTVCLVEWADRTPEIRLYQGYRELSFGFGLDEERVIKVSK